MGAATVVAEMDGGMVPTVTPDASQADRRKGKCLQWKEAKLCLAHAKGGKTLRYGGTLQGDADTAGQQLLACAKAAGFGTNRTAKSMRSEMAHRGLPIKSRAQLGAQGHYLLDFFHVCEYLSAAAKTLTDTPQACETWMTEQKEKLKVGHAQAVIDTLKTQREAPDTPDTEAPVRGKRRAHAGLTS